ncbi:MAG TPA: NAD(P) transhydrogenase subunit alpha [Phycisphaerae bacterium]|nr:NAD(P) transhydrogenase subunit alpha [Phycisphaerae bacterium]HOJ72923.1 NAD(P) transhydrogenase subunit alpha [Phycisphaerae bacterium]HOM50107.1 NAD(P) transhydrogenase subunit alpha [Phycisphaerae bacterium]HON69286.1 NAD(P) transhydrogenase subunit alpha [Phycisphaerae bacterium]HOQ86651.1 NAD(P) transhydrogenase subunit alpha [Phycisphaerae bacterium]
MLDVLLMLVVLGVAGGLGYYLISRIPPMLHTPLMSMTNAVSGVVVLGCLLLFAVQLTWFERALGAVALAAAVFNLVGGFAITHRMLTFFGRDSSRSANTGD